MSAIMDIPLKKIKFAEDTDGLLNPRGEVRDASDLKESMAIAGQERAIIVVESEDGFFYPTDGHRRVVAARALKWKTIRAEVKEVSGNDGMLAAMLASNVSQKFKPSAHGRAIAKLSRAEAWGIERVAKVCGMAVDHAQLLVDLSFAPEAVQQRVDSGEMSLSAWKVLRDKPREVQETAASLDKPTVANCRQTVRQSKQQAPSGVFADMLNQMSGEHTLVAALNEARARLLAEWHGLTEAERSRVYAVLDSMTSFVDSTPMQIGA